MSLNSAPVIESSPVYGASHPPTLSPCNASFATLDPGSLELSHDDIWSSLFGNPINSSASGQVRDSHYTDLGVQLEQDRTTAPIPGTPCMKSSSPRKTVVEQRPHNPNHTISDINVSPKPMCGQRVRHFSSLAWNEPTTVESPPSARPQASTERSTNIPQPDENGKYRCFWLGCTYRDGFSRDLSLWRHIKAKHLHPGAIECLSCGKRFDRPDSLRAHQRATRHGS